MKSRVTPRSCIAKLKNGRTPCSNPAGIDGWCPSHRPKTTRPPAATFECANKDLGSKGQGK